MSRLALIVSVAALACLAGPASALGCITSGGSAQTVGGGPETPVHPGDPMELSISNLDEGANWTVSVGGRVVGSGTTVAHGNVEGRFTLGDYGPAARTINVSVYVEHPTAGSGHDGAADFRPDALSIHYEPAPAVQTPTEKPSGDSAKPAPTGGSGPAQATAPVGATPPTPAAPAIAVPRRSAPAAPAHVTKPARPHATAPRQGHRSLQRTTRPVATARGAPHSGDAASAGHVVSRSAPPPRVTRPHTAVRAARAPANRRAGFIVRGRAHDKVMPAITRAPTYRANAASPENLWLVAGLIVLFLLAAGGLGRAAVRLRGSPAPEVDAAALEIEAELQEIISEHRAGELPERETSSLAGPPG